MFNKLKPLPPDAIIGIMAMFRADQSPKRADLSVGVYQDDSGKTPVLGCVKKAERRLLESEDTKTYVAIAGNAAYNRGIEQLLFGDGHPALADGRVATVQAPGGSGALAVAAHLVERAKHGAKVYLSDPSWPNHLPLFKLAGLQIEQYPYYDYRNHRVDFEGMVHSIERMHAGDLLLLHGCCHNPCGADLTHDQWKIVVELCERVGSCSVVAANREQRDAVMSNLANVARGLYSMPPDHGAAITALILHDDDLKAEWVAELAGMRDRLNGMREFVVGKLHERGTPVDFSFIARERGLFSFLGLTKAQIVRLREEFHVYMVESSRVNIAGFNRSNADYICDAIAAVLR